MMQNFKGPVLSNKQVSIRAVLATLSFALLPGVSAAEIIWSGDFSTGDFTQWHSPEDPTQVTFHQIKPEYGRPPQYGQQHLAHIGNGELLSLVTSSSGLIDNLLFRQGPTRGSSKYAGKFTVKNSANGSEPADCDGSVCSRRRTFLTMQSALHEYYKGMPYGSERWLSVSYYVPSDWSDAGSGFGVVVFGLKPRYEGGGGEGSTGILGISIESGVWRINHRWSPEYDSPMVSEAPWQHGMFYMGPGGEGGPACYPRAGGPNPTWADGVRHFPDEAKSCAALSSINKGGWTDWVVHIKADNRGAQDDGTGFLRVWKREDADPWVQVLDIKPGKVSRGGITFDHGIGYGPGSGGYGPKVGMYMDKAQVWGLPDNRVLYVANVKVADAKSDFSALSPDGSSPGSDAVVAEEEPSPPNPPTLE